MKRLNVLDWISLILVIIGGLNWGLVGLLKLDLVSLIFGQMSGFSRIIYILIGLAALYLLYFLFKPEETKINRTSSGPGPGPGL